MPTSRVTVHFPCPVERVWQTVTNLANTAWRSDLKRVEVLDETHFVEHTKSGYATNFTVTACEPLRRWAFTMEKAPYHFYVNFRSTIIVIFLPDYAIV